MQSVIDNEPLKFSNMKLQNPGDVENLKWDIRNSTQYVNFALFSK